MEDKSALWLAEGTALRCARVENGMKQSELAKKLGISASYLSFMEIGKRGISEKVHDQLKEIFGYSLKDRILNNDPDNPNESLTRDSHEEIAARLSAARTRAAKLTQAMENEGTLLSYYRKRARLSANELALLSGVSAYEIKAIERGDIGLSPENLFKFAAPLKLSETEVNSFWQVASQKNSPMPGGAQVQILLKSFHALLEISPDDLEALLQLVTQSQTQKKSLEDIYAQLLKHLADIEVSVSGAKAMATQKIIETRSAMKVDSTAVGAAHSADDELGLLAQLMASNRGPHR